MYNKSHNINYYSKYCYKQYKKYCWACSEHSVKLNTVYCVLTTYQAQRKPFYIYHLNNLTRYYNYPHFIEERLSLWETR